MADEKEDPEQHADNPNNQNKSDNEKSDDSKSDTPITSKKRMTKALTSLITKFTDEAQQQDEILHQIQVDSANNPNFGNKSAAYKWTVNEVCHWLTTIDLQTYCHSFIESKIDGNILLNDLTEHTLSNDLKIKPIHCSKILREIKALKHKISKTNDLQISDIIASIKQKNEHLLNAFNAQTNKSELLNSPSINKSLSDIVKSQNAMIEQLTLKVNALQTKGSKQIKELQVMQSVQNVHS